MENKQYLTPLAIIIAGLIIGGALYFKPTTPGTAGPASTGLEQQKNNFAKLAPVKNDEHVRGNPNAPIKIVEFSDLECPYCKVFHFAMENLMAKYGPSGKVAWIYRHFPLDKGARALHPKAGPEAVAAECVAKIAGNESFWNYVDQIFAITPSNNRLDLAILPKLAADLKIDSTAFANCTTNNEVKSVIDSHYQDGVKVGVDGTPYSIALLPKNEKVLLFRQELPSDLDADTKAVIDDLYQFEQESLQKLSEQAQQAKAN